MGSQVPRSRPQADVPAAQVLDLGLARESRRLRDFQSRCRAVEAANKKSLARLFQGGLIFTRHGARLGRELLLAHQHLLRIIDLLARIGELPGAGQGSEAEVLYAEAQTLLARTSELTARCGVVLARQR